MAGGVSLDWFNMLYQVAARPGKSPRFGSFVAVYGLANAVTMIDGALAVGIAGPLPHPRANSERTRRC